MKRFAFAVGYSAIFVSLLASCMSRQFIDGKVEIISVSDTTLNDSSLFVGYVYEHPDHWPDQRPVQAAEIWLDGQDSMVTSNGSGYYSLKTVPGICTVKCQRNMNKWPQLIGEVKRYKINKKEKVQINFYLGYTVE